MLNKLKSFTKLPNRALSAQIGTRTDIQALRCIAALGVVIGHLAPLMLPGPVVLMDTFFVVSGYLMTLSILRMLERLTVRRMLAEFYARRIKRLMPASTVLLLFVLLFTVIQPQQISLWGRTIRQVIASTIFMQNYQLIDESTDYFASDEYSTPLVHFWSLSIEEQFYFVWPLALGIIFLIIKKFAKNTNSFTKVIGVLVGIVIIISYAYNLYATTNFRITAYYMTTVRAWELAIGALAAVISLRTANIKILQSEKLQLFIPWLSIAAIFISALFVAPQDGYPGNYGTVATLSTALIVLFGHKNTESSRWSFCNVMNHRLIQLGGDMSYSVYIWHWPIIILIPQVFAIELSPLVKVMLFIISYVTAYFSWRFIETPFRAMRVSKVDLTNFSHKIQPIYKIYGLGALCMALIFSFSLPMNAKAYDAVNNAIQSMHEFAENDNCAGAKAIDNDACDGSDPFGTLQKEFTAGMEEDNFRRDLGDTRPDELGDMAGNSCSLGNYNNICFVGDTKAKEIVLVWGDSHVAQWFDALDYVGKKNHFRIALAYRFGCTAVLEVPKTFNFLEDGGDDPEKCVAFNKQVLEGLAPRANTIFLASRWSRYVSYWKEDYVEKRVLFASGDAGSLSVSEEAQSEFSAKLLEVVNSRQTNYARANGGIHIIQDTPQTYKLAPLCLIKFFADCRVPEGIAIADDFITLAITEADIPGVDVLWTKDRFCNDGYCYLAIGGLPVYSDEDHLTSSYSKTLGPWLDEQFSQKLRGQRR